MAGMNRSERTFRRHLLRAIENGKHIPPLPMGEIISGMVDNRPRRRNIPRHARR